MSQSSSILAGYSEGSDSVTVSIKKQSTRYFDELLNLLSAPDMAPLFPNAKEITESFAAHAAVRKHLWKLAPPNDPSVHVVCVADGSTPRTAALFAYRSRWQCHSVDPNLKLRSRLMRIERLHLYRDKIQNVAGQLKEKISDSKCLLVAVHSHCPLGEAAAAMGPNLVGIVAIPCCVNQELNTSPTLQYEDWGIWSPKRTVKVWRF